MRLAVLSTNQQPTTTELTTKNAEHSNTANYYRTQFHCDLTSTLAVQECFVVKRRSCDIMFLIYEISLNTVFAFVYTVRFSFRFLLTFLR